MIKYKTLDKDKRKKMLVFNYLLLVYICSSIYFYFIMVKYQQNYLIKILRMFKNNILMKNRLIANDPHGHIFGVYLPQKVVDYVFLLKYSIF